MGFPGTSKAGQPPKAENVIVNHPIEAKAVTTGAHHFFGYYDKFPWDSSGRYLLGLESTFLDRQPTADDTVTVGVIDLEANNQWQAIGHHPGMVLAARHNVTVAAICP